MQRPRNMILLGLVRQIEASEAVITTDDLSQIAMITNGEDGNAAGSGPDARSADEGKGGAGVVE
jgi:hypothetical protein